MVREEELPPLLRIAIAVDAVPFEEALAALAPDSISSECLPQPAGSASAELNLMVQAYYLTKILSTEERPHHV